MKPLFAALAFSAALLAQNPIGARYPAAIVDDTSLTVATNAPPAVRTLTTAISIGATSLTLSSVDGLLAPIRLTVKTTPTGPGEVFKCLARDVPTKTFTSCTGGQEDTTPANHPRFSLVYNYLTAEYSNQMAAEIKAIESTLGVNMQNVSPGGVVLASSQTGGDCGAKINVANASLGAVAGEIIVNQACGTTWTTAVTLTANHTLRFTQGGIYTYGAKFTLGNNVSIIGNCRGNVIGSTCTELKEADGANLSLAFDFTGYGGTIQDIYLNGNKANNAGALDGVGFTSAKSHMYNVTVDGFKRHNIVLKANTQETQIWNSTSANAGGNGIEVQSGATDMTLSNNYVVNNAVYQFHGSGTFGGVHIIGGDYSSGASASHCIFLDGTAGIVNFFQINDVAILPCGGTAIYVVNGNGGTISGNYLGNGSQSSLGTYDGIRISYYGFVAISGNSIFDGQTPATLGRCINITGGTQPNTISGNQCYANKASTDLFATNYLDRLSGNSVANSAGEVPVKTTMDGLSGILGSIPTLTSCGAGPVILGTNTLGIVQIVTGTTCTLNFSVAWPSTPACVVTSRAGAVFAYTTSTSALTITGGGTITNTILDYVCGIP